MILSKKYIHHFLIFLSAVFLFACKEHHRSFKPTTTVISGQITSAPELILSLQGVSTIKSALDASGKFSLSSELTEAGIYRIILADQSFYIYIEPGARISVTGDYRTLPESLMYKGDHAKENQYLVAYEKLKASIEPEDYGMFFTQSEAEFIKSVEYRTNRLYEDQQEYQKKNGTFDPLFEELISDEVAFDAAVVKMNYPDYYRYFAPDSVLKLSDTYDSFLQNLDLDNDENLMVPAYRPFVSKFVEYKMAQDTSTQEATATGRKFNLIDKVFQSVKTAAYLYHNVMQDAIENSINEAAVWMPEYRKRQTDAEWQKMDEELFAARENLLKGKPAPTIRGLKLSGENISLATLKGKVLYIDVWASWCGPCLHELPYLEALQEKFKSNGNIAFISVSVDEDKAAWRNMVKQKNMKGLQLLVPGGWNAEIIRDYSISGIPRFMIIGKDGNIINATAPRPSSSEIVRELEEALR